MIPVAFAARLLPIRKALSAVPRAVWLALAALLAVWLAVSWHKRTVAAADRAGFERGVAITKAAYRKALAGARVVALQRRAAAESESRRINQELTRETDRLRARIAADARRLLDQGPGAAACPRRVDHPGLSAGSGAPAAARHPPDASRSSVPPGDWSAVPWQWLVRRAEGHDALLTYMLQDQEWHRRQEEAWKNARGRP